MEIEIGFLFNIIFVHTKIPFAYEVMIVREVDKLSMITI